MIKTGPEGVSNVNPEFYIEFNFDFLDDTYKKYREKEIHADENIYTGKRTWLSFNALVAVWVPDWFLSYHQNQIVYCNKNVIVKSVFDYR